MPGRTRWAVYDARRDVYFINIAFGPHCGRPWGEPETDLGAGEHQEQQL